MTYGTGSYGATPYGAGDDAGLTLYWAIQPSGTANWANNATGGGYIRDGKDGTGSALSAGSYGSQAYTAAGQIDMATAASGLTPNTSYEFGFVLYDSAADEYSNVVVSSAFTTALLISGVPAAVTISGQAASIITGAGSPTVINATPASISIAGQTALISVGRQVNTTPATVSVTASPASVISGVGAGTLLGTTPASVVLAASSAQIIVGKVLNTSPASLSVNGASALVTNSAITVYLRAGSWIRYIQL